VGVRTPKPATDRPSLVGHHGRRQKGETGLGSPFLPAAHGDVDPACHVHELDYDERGEGGTVSQPRLGDGVVDIQDGHVRRGRS
jgi:hypothetical protein